MRKWLLVSLLCIAIYTRFVGIDWGLPYPMHPDERNMADAIQKLECSLSDLKNCFNPQFFAYGQLPLYIGYLLVQVFHVVINRSSLPITFYEATIALRFISATASIINVFVLLKIINLVITNQRKKKHEVKISSWFTEFMAGLICIFAPFAIQFAHFGTTESILMLLYSLIVLLCLHLLILKKSKKYVVLLSLYLGLSFGVKVSSAVFALPILFVFLYIDIYKSKSTFLKKIKAFIVNLLIVGVVSILMAIISSPYNFISFEAFLNTIRYESAVATGDARVFYTQQFDNTVPVFFQLTRIFPYVLGVPMYVCALIGFIFLSWRNIQHNFLRIAFLVFFIPTSFLYAKWSRFISPVLPLMSMFSVLFIFKLSDLIQSAIYSRVKLQKINRSYNYLKKYLLTAFTLIIILPGLAYISIYTNPDVRFLASQWIYNNIDEGAVLLSETANVVDIPLQSEISQKLRYYQNTSFNHYDLDTDSRLFGQLNSHLASADYIVVPSRRVFANYSCWKPDLKYSKKAVGYSPNHCDKIEMKYPRLSMYYQQLFSNTTKYQQVAKFTSYPNISFFGRTLLEFPDEMAEETWTVFDHPVIRIYKRI